MLTIQNYKRLWTATLGMPIQTIPCYYQYLQREVYFQDYLDLFCCPPGGNETFQRVQINGHQTVDIPNLPPDSTGAYTVIDPATGNVKLIVDYDFPYKGELCKNRKIERILIGEAPPATGKYIYKDASGSYITAPLRAVGINPQPNTINRLLQFANNGYLHLDLYPFAIDFSNSGNLRSSLVGNNAIITAFINRLIAQIIALKCLDPNWDFCMVAPETTSIGILDWINVNGGRFNGKPAAHPTNDLIGSPDFKIVKRNGQSISKGNYTPNPGGNIWALGHLSKQAKFAVAIGGSGPNHHLVKRAF